MIDYLGSLSPLPYYMNHVVIAGIISVAANFIATKIWYNPYKIFALSGGTFYAIRELIQWQQLGYFDHPGFWWPVLVNLFSYGFILSLTFRQK